MNNLTLARSIRQIEGNGSDQSLDGIGKRGLIAQIIVANADSPSRLAKVLLNDKPLYVSVIESNSTEVQELAVPVNSDDTVKFNAPASVHLTLVFVEPGQ